MNKSLLVFCKVFALIFIVGWAFISFIRWEIVSPGDWNWALRLLLLFVCTYIAAFAVFIRSQT